MHLYKALGLLDRLSGQPATQWASQLPWLSRAMVREAQVPCLATDEMTQMSLRSLPCFSIAAAGALFFLRSIPVSGTTALPLSAHEDVREGEMDQT